MTSEDPIHPLRKWRSGRYSCEELSELVRALGGQMSKRYCEAIENDYRRPAYELCKILVKLGGEAFSIDDLRGRRLKSERSAA